MVQCCVCRVRARYRESSPTGQHFCTHLCQRAWHGVAGRALADEDALVREEDFFLTLRRRLWGVELPTFPTKDVVFDYLGMPDVWPRLTQLVPNLLQPKGATEFEVGASGAKLALAVYTDPDHDAPFLLRNTVMLLKSVRVSHDFDSNTATMINEACTGARAGALFFAGISRIFVPVVDFFACMCDAKLLEEATHPRFFAVQTVVENGLEINEAVVHDASDDPKQTVAFVRSILAQVLCALEAAQHHIQFTHYDLHLGNVLAEETSSVENEVWTHVRPDGNQTIYFDPRHTRGRIVRIIDFGLSRANDPYREAPATFLDNERREFDAHIDTRKFAYDFIARVLVPSAQVGVDVPEFETSLRKVRSVISGAPGIMRVLGAMMGTSSWTNLAPPGGEYNIVLRPCPRLGRFEDVTAHLELPFDTHQLVRFLSDAGRSRSAPFVEQEIRNSRTDDRSAPTPHDILNDRFFDPLRRAPNNVLRGFAKIVSIGDARRQFPHAQD